jgi:hypothetical protein
VAEFKSGLILHDFFLHAPALIWLEYLYYFSNLCCSFCFDDIWHRQYMIIFSLTRFGIHDLWSLLSCVGDYQTVTSLSCHQSHIWIHCNGDNIKRLSYFTLPQQQLLLPKWVRNVILHHPVQSKWQTVKDNQFWGEIRHNKLTWKKANELFTHAIMLDWLIVVFV